MIPLERLRCRLNRFQRCQIHLQKVELAFAGWNFFFDLLDRSVTSFLRSCSEDNLQRIVLGELKDRLFAQTSASSCYDNNFASEVRDFLLRVECHD